LVLIALLPFCESRVAPDLVFKSGYLSEKDAKLEDVLDAIASERRAGTPDKKGDA